MREYVKAIAICCWLLLTSCSSSPTQHQPVPMIQDQVRSTTDLNQLQNLQKSLRLRLEDKDPWRLPAEFALLGDIERRIVELQVARVEQLLNSAQGSNAAAVPLPALTELRQHLHNTSGQDPALLAAALEPIAREEAVTGSLINTLETEAASQSLSAERRATVYQQLYALSGLPKWREGRDKQMDVLIKAIHATIAQNVVNKSLEDRVDFVRGIYMTEPQPIIDDMQGVYAEIFAKRYKIAQSRGDMNAAFVVLQDLTRKQDYEEIRAKLQPMAAGIAADYAAYVAQSIDRKWHLAQSYRRFHQEIEVRRILGLPPQPHPNTPELIQQVSAKYHTLESENNPFATLGALYALLAIGSNSEAQAFAMAHQLTEIRNTTIKTIGIGPFRSRYEQHDYGRLVAALILDKLQDTAGDGLQIVAQDGNALVDLDALVSGTILEVKVDSSQARQKKQLQVTVGENHRPNPSYLAWLELPPKERAKREKPPETLSESQQETIAITSTLHRKSGIFAASYRLVDARSARVIYPDSITLHTEHKDESHEGVEVGTLVVPYKVAKLPPDAEILQQLARDVATVIAANLTAILQNQEIEYLKMADKSAAQNNCNQEVEDLAKAVTLMQTRKNGVPEETKKIRDRLVDRTLACF